MPTTACLLAVVSEPSDFAHLAAELSDLGVKTCYAKEVSELLGAGQRHAPSVILCDADRINWSDTLRSLKAAMPQTAVVFLTRLADERLWVRMLQAGAFDLLEKPYRARDLRWVIGTALKRPHERHAAMSAA